MDFIECHKSCINIERKKEKKKKASNNVTKLGECNQTYPNSIFVDKVCP